MTDTTHVAWLHDGCAAQEGYEAAEAMREMQGVGWGGL